MTTQGYPVTYDIEKPEHYNRWTVAFRLILAIPQLILVGAGGYHLFALNGAGDNQAGDAANYGFNGGVLMAVLAVLVFFAWFGILFTGRFPASFRDFCHMIFRWSQNVRAYVLLQAAPYPPFGDKPYPLRVTITPAEHYNRWTVFFRLFMVIPHAVVLFFLGIAQGVVTVIAWFAILFTGQYPDELFEFSVGVSRWYARVEAYTYLFVDEYPPFSLAAEPGAAAMTAQPA